MIINNNGPQIQLWLDNGTTDVEREVKDLGIQVSNDLKFGSHINKMVAKASARACLVHKCFVSRDVGTLSERLKVMRVPY